MDLASYLDWAALRPITELEFEKACRGPNVPVGNEYAWGNTNIHTSAYTLAQEYLPDEYISNTGTYTGNCAYISTMVPPVRCGIFAASSTNHSRQETGATYYGIMEMSGNMTEPIVTCGNAAGQSFTGKHGNGSLDSLGNANQDFWPGINGNAESSTANTAYLGSTGVSHAAGSGYKGGCIFCNANICEISDRNGVSVLIIYRLSYYGGRGCRTAP
jgi:hypothetical protein